MKKPRTLSEDEIEKQNEYVSRLLAMNNGEQKYVYIRTFGCQQNEADSEKLLGMAVSMGYTKTDDPANASLILINTCAVREHAELKALSITGSFKSYKEADPSLVIGICGCMVAQEHRKDDIKKRYPYVDFLLGSTLIHRLPEILFATKVSGGRNFWIDNDDTIIAESVPVYREKGKTTAWVSVMYGCNNFCTYCIVPYVRGRERSREKQTILAEIQSLLADGVKEITLLGQNVNSYGKDLGECYDFSDLLTAICNLDGEAKIHFMTSHPKDATKKLIDTIASHPTGANKIGISASFHLPVQSGNDEILQKMNRGYTRDSYLKLINYAKEKIPNISLSTDIIVGFPGETEEQFLDTLSIMRQVEYDNVYSFVYSKRNGTIAAEMENQVSTETKNDRISRLLALQNDISKKINLAYEGKTLRVLVEGVSKKNSEVLTARTEKNKVVHFVGDLSLKNSYVYVKIERADAHALHGVLVENCDKN